MSEQVTGKLKNGSNPLVRADDGSAKEHKSTLDLISRSRAIKEVSEWATDILHPKNLIKEDAIGILESLPSADRPTGEWIEVEVLPEVYDIEGVKSWGSKMQCDQCGFIFTAIEGHITQYNFCPNCGAKMGGRRTDD